MDIPCDVDATCMNSIGSYSCKCNSGFEFVGDANARKICEVYEDTKSSDIKWSDDEGDPIGTCEPITCETIRLVYWGPKLYLKVKMVISRVPELELNQNALSLVKQDIFLNHLILQLLIRNIPSRV